MTGTNDGSSIKGGVDDNKNQDKDDSHPVEGVVEKNSQFESLMHGNTSPY